MRPIYDEADAAREYYGTEYDPYEEMEIAQKQRERYFNTYCQDRANGLTHEEAADECRSLALEFKDEYERQIEIYENAIRRTA